MKTSLSHKMELQAGTGHGAPIQAPNKLGKKDESNSPGKQALSKHARLACVKGFALGLLTSLSLPLTCTGAIAQSLGSSLDSQLPPPAASIAPPPPSVQTRADSSTFKRPSKDFKYRKRFIAPSSDLYNRVDYQSMQPSRDSLMLPNYEPTWGKGQPNSQSTARPPVTYQPSHPTEPQEALKAQAQSLGNTKSLGRPMVSREGLTPPPPPANNRLLPSSLTKPPSTTGGLAGTNQIPVSQASPSQNLHENVQGIAPVASQLSAARIAQIKSQADAMVKSGHLAEAQEALTRVVQEHPHEPVLRAQLSTISLDRARFYSKLGNHQDAASQARLAIAYGSAYSSASESAYALLANSLTKAGVDPRSASARASLGQSLLSQHNPIEAEIEFRQAIKLKPQSDYYLGAGTASLQSGNKTSAKLDFQKALELNPESQPAMSKLGEVRYQMRDYVGANADLTRALVMDSQDTEAAQTLIDLWQRQVATRPGDAGAHLGLARAYQVTGDLEGARKEYKTVVKIDPNHPNLPAARQSFKLALAKREAKKSFELAHSFESQAQLPAAYQKASDAVELYPSDSGYQAYKAQLAGQLQAAGLPVYAVSGQALQALSFLMANGEQPPAANLPTAQALGLNPGMAPPDAQAQAAAMANSPAANMAVENMYKPLSTDAHVTSMTGFLASLRNFTMQQQAAQSGGSAGGGAGGLSSLGGAPSSGAMAGDAASLMGLSGVPGFAPASPLPTSLDSGQLIAQGAQAQSMLAGTAGGAAPGAASSGKVTAQSALQAAAAALANTAGGALGIGGAGASAAAAGGGIASATAGGLSAGGATAGAGSGIASAISGGGTSGFLGGLAAGLGGDSGTTLGASSTAAPAAQAAAAAPTAANLGVSNSMAAMALGLAPQAAPSMASTMIGGLGQAASYLAKNRQTSATGNLAPQSVTTQYPGQMNYGFTPNGNFATNQQMPTTVTQRTITSPGGSAATAMPLSAGQEPSNVAWPQPQPLPDSTASAGAQAQALSLSSTHSPPAATTAVQPMVSATSAASDPTSAATALALAPPIVPAGQLNTNGLTSTNLPPGQTSYTGGPGATPLRSLIPPGALKLYLTGVKASKSEVELQVNLRNDSPVPLKIPGGIKAIVRSGGQPDKQGKISFTSHQVNSGATVAGTIKVPGKSLDPTADVMIPISALTKGAIADIHLSVPISSK